MTPEQAWTRVRQIAFELEKADYGMGMPRDYSRVLELRVLLEQARKDAAEAECNADEYPSADELREARADLYGRQS